MTTPIMTQPKPGERAIVSYYGHRAPATWVGLCSNPKHGHLPHWCFDKPTPSGFTWTLDPDAEREPIPEPPSVTLTLEEISDLVGDDMAFWLSNKFMSPDLIAEKVRWWISTALTAREQALREEIAEEIEACNTVARRSVSPGQAAYRLGYEVAQGRAARIVRGGAR